MIADEVMCGWGRTGEWFAVNNWNVVPDIITTAKGLTSSYAPLGAVGLAPHVAAYFDENMFWGGLTYNTHPLGVAAAIAAIDVLEDDDLIGNAKRLDPVMRAHHEESLAASTRASAAPATSGCSASSSSSRTARPWSRSHRSTR